jgi:hypothetical protein|tara:strand:- start:2971 stop:3156 length:186 start_codon:yes stop_codon:yes gene_type:complete
MRGRRRHVWPDLGLSWCMAWTVNLSFARLARALGLPAPLPFCIALLTLAILVTQARIIVGQ